LLVSLAPPRIETGLGNETGILPKDRISQEQITVLKDHAELDIPNLEWAVIESTSMLPVLGPGTHVLQAKPSFPEALQIGDIVSFAREDKIIIHRIIEKGTDEQGWYVITKGDNNPTDDGKIRFDQIDRVLVGIIY